MSFYSNLPSDELIQQATRFPEQAEWRLALVEQKAKNQDFAEALDHALLAKSRNAKDPEVESWLAMCLIYNHRVVEGHQRLQRVVRNYPNRELQERLITEIVPAFTGYDTVAQNQGWMSRVAEDAVGVPDSFLAQNRSFVQAMNQSELDPAKGTRLLESHIAQYPDDINALLYLAMAMSADNRPDKAARIYREVIQTDPMCATAYFDLAATVNDVDESIRLTRRGLSLCPDAVHARYNLGLYLIEKGDYALARQELTRIPADSRIYTDAVVAVAMTHEEEGQPTAALKSLKRAVKLAGDRGEVRARYGQLLCDCGMVEEGLVQLDLSIDMDPEQGTVWLHKGAAHLGLGEYEQAETALEQALALEPDCQDAAINLAVLVSDRGDDQRALEILEQADQNDPNHDLICLNMGAIYCNLGQLDKALESTLKAARLGADSAGLHWNLANIYCLMDNKSSCLAHLQLAIERDELLANRFQKDIYFRRFWTDPDFLAVIHDD